MKTAFKIACLLLFNVVACNYANSQQSSARESWVSLFNGKDLKGWDIKISGNPVNDNYKNTFRVEDGMIRIAYDQYKQFDGKYGHLYFNKSFSHYILRFQYRFTGKQTPGGAVWNERNSGVMIHSQSAKSLSLNQDFPVSLEVQLLGGLNNGDRPTGNVCTPGTQVHFNGVLSKEHCINSSSKTYNGDQWVHVTVVVLGDSIIKHIVEGDTVLTYERTEIGGGFVNKDYDFKAAHVDNAQYWIDKDGTPLKEGYIALQAESHPVDFKDIELLNLEGCMDQKAKNYKAYYVKSDKKQCRY